MGPDIVDHGPNPYDDLVNAVAGAVVLVMAASGRKPAVELSTYLDLDRCCIKPKNETAFEESMSGL